MIVPTPTGTAGPLTTAATIAARTAFQIARSPQILGIAVVQSVVFLLVFRYVIGGAIGVEGVSYVNFLVPGFIVSAVVFTANGVAVAVAEDAAGGFYDRLRSLPIPGVAVIAGRAVSDAALMVLVGIVTLAVGFAIGFRPTGSVLSVAAALGLVAIYGLVFALVFGWLGLVAGNAQTAQGLGVLGVPLSFLSSAFVPVDTMPGVLRTIAEWQPLTFMIDSGRGLMLGNEVTRTFDHALSYYVLGSLLWCVVLLAIFAPLAVRAYRRV